MSGKRMGTSCRRTSAAILCVTLALFATTAFPQAFSQPALPPQVINFCDAECATLYLTTDRRGYWGLRDAPSPARGTPHGIWINRFDATGIELVRHDPPTPIFPQGLRGTITGRIAPDGNHMIDGKTTWTFGMATAYDAHITWGPLLDSIPSAGLAPGESGMRARQTIQAALASQRAALTDSTSTGAASDDGVTFGEFDLRAYRHELARSDLTIKTVRRAEFYERINGKDVAHTVLIIDSFYDDYRTVESTGVRDYLEHKPGDRSTKYGPEDIVNRDIICSNGVTIYGGIDRQNVFQLNVEIRPDSRGRAGLNGRDVWRPTLDELTKMTTSLTYDPATFRDIVRESIRLNSQRYPDAVFVPDLGPGRHYDGSIESASVVSPGPAEPLDEGQRLLNRLQDILDERREEIGGDEPPQRDGGPIEQSKPRYMEPDGGGAIKPNKPKYMEPEGSGVIRRGDSGSQGNQPPKQNSE